MNERTKRREYQQQAQRHQQQQQQLRRRQRLHNNNNSNYNNNNSSSSSNNNNNSSSSSNNNNNNSSRNNNNNNTTNNNNNNNTTKILNTNTTNDSYDTNNHHHHNTNNNNNNTTTTTSINNNKVASLQYALTPAKTDTATMSPNLAKTGTQVVAVSPLVASARLMNSKVLAMSQGFDVRSDLATSLRTMKNSVRDVEEAASHDLSMISTNHHDHHHDHDRDRKSVRWRADEQTPRVSNNLGASKLEMSDLIQRSPQRYNNAPTITIEDSFYTSRDLDQQRDRDFYREIIDRSDRLSLSPSAHTPRKGLMTINNSNRNSNNNNSNRNSSSNNNNNIINHNHDTKSHSGIYSHNTNKGIMKSPSSIPTPTPIPTTTTTPITTTTTTTTHKLEGVSASLSTLKAKAQRLLNSLAESEPPKKRSQLDQA